MNEKIYKTLTSTSLTYEQKVLNLARDAENELQVLNVDAETQCYLDEQIICTLFEGNAPYRPRYIMPDYQKALQNGCKFLKLEPPTDLDEAINFLSIFYKHVPSITSYPVFLGDLDILLNPYLDGYNDEEIIKKIKLFFRFLDRSITDSFCHGNLSPIDNRAARLILQANRELCYTVPNLTLKYDEGLTSDDYAEYALATSLYGANPAIANNKAHKDTFKTGYGVSSCYNILPIGGGSHTLVRLVLPRLAKKAKNKEHFLNELLPHVLKLMGDYMNERIKFLVEKSGFFESSFLVDEGFIDKDNFMAMFGVVGLAECANILNDTPHGYGNDPKTNDLAIEILTVIDNYLSKAEALYSNAFNNRFGLHAQVGLDSDLGISSGVRIPVGDEPERMFDHIALSARTQHFFPTGAADIFPFEKTAKKNPACMLDIVKGAFKLGNKYISFYASDSDVVRITGYLVKRSEMQDYYDGKPVLQNTTQLGADNYKNQKLANRKVRNSL